jgi:hypothetical protein
MSNTLETKIPNQTRTDEDDEINLLGEEHGLLTDNDKTNNQQYELETHDEAQLLDS